MKGLTMFLHRVDDSKQFSMKSYTALLFMVAVLPLIIPNQAITGVIVNGILVFSSLTFGLRRTSFVALLPSLAGVLSGIIPMAMLPMVPFIILGNLALVGIVCGLKRYEWQSVLIGAVVKCALLFFTAKVMVSYFIAGEVGNNILVVMGVNQLYTALTGGALAILLRKVMK